MATSNLTVQELRRFLDYDPSTGQFTRLVNNGTAKTGDVAGWIEPSGYRKISIAGRKYYAHRCAILFMTGVWPSQSVDHIDGDRANNRYENLRCVGQQTNTQNLKKAKSNNKSGYLGVCFNRNAKKYMAECKGDDGKRRYLGLFDTAEEAAAAYLKAKRETQSGCAI